MTTIRPAAGKPRPVVAKAKAIVDNRIELTDAELRASRDQYDQEQQRIAREIDRKKRDKREYLFAVDVRMMTSLSGYVLGHLIDLVPFLVSLGSS